MGCVFKNKAGADHSVKLAAGFVKKSLSKYMNQKPEIIEGKPVVPKLKKKSELENSLLDAIEEHGTEVKDGDKKQD